MALDSKTRVANYKSYEKFSLKLISSHQKKKKNGMLLTLSPKCKLAA